MPAILQGQLRPAARKPRRKDRVDHLQRFHRRAPTHRWGGSADRGLEEFALFHLGFAGARLNGAAGMGPSQTKPNAVVKATVPAGKPRATTALAPFPLPPTLDLDPVRLR